MDYANSDDWKQKLDIPDMVAAIISLVVLGVVYFFCPLRPMYVPENDSQSDYPGNGSSTVPSWWLFILCGLIPAIFIISLYFLGQNFPDYFKKFEIAAAIWLYIVVLAMTNICTQILKTYVGRPRPDIYNRCGAGPYAQYGNCPELSSKSLADEWKSWPSGHSSNTMCAFTFIVLFIQKSIQGIYLITNVIATGLLLIAFFVGGSRIVDFRHHSDDVLAGLFIGYVFAQLVWNRVYKRVFPKYEVFPMLPTDINSQMSYGMP